MSKKKHNCTQCDFTAKSASGLKTHARMKHTQSKRHERFDLDIKSQEQSDELVAYMLEMTATSGWRLLKQIMENNISVLEAAIIDKTDPLSGEQLKEEEVEEARKKRNIMKELIEKPNQLIETFKRQAGIATPTYDPYATDVRQFNPHSNVGDPMARTLQS